MGKHAELETGRLELIMQQIGSTEPIRDEFEEECVYFLLKAMPSSLTPRPGRSVQERPLVVDFLR